MLTTKQAITLLFFIAINNCINTHTMSELPSAMHKTQIIEQALALELPSTDAIHTDEIDDIEQMAWCKVVEAHYEEAIQIITDGLHNHPTSFALQSCLASMLGDCSKITASPLKELMIQRSKELFNQLITEADEQPELTFYPFMNEYYYRFAMYEEQYKLGIERVNKYWNTDQFTTDVYRGYYSQGVGAANYARELVKSDNIALARTYAQKAVVAWAQYFSYINDYYNAYVHYALALGILGLHEEMERALIRSGTLIQQDLHYFEFQEVISFVDQYASVLVG